MGLLCILDRGIQICCDLLSTLLDVADPISLDVLVIHCFSMFQMCQLISEQPFRERPEFVAEGRRRFSGGPHFLTDGGGNNCLGPWLDN